MRAPQWVQSIDEPEAWAIEHRWLLEAALAEFDRTGEWPLIEDVQRALATTPERAVAVRQLVIDIPPALGARFSQRVELTVRALSFCPDGASLLALFVRAMQQAVSCYPGDGPGQPVLHGHQIKTNLQLTDEEYRKVSTLLFSEGWFFGNGGGDAAGNWNREVGAEILRIRDVTDIAGYLDAVAEYRFGPPEIELPATDTSRLPVLRRPRSWLAKRDPSVSDLLIITVVGGAIVGVLLWLLLG
jgi:hypothetical protein